MMVMRAKAGRGVVEKRRALRKTLLEEDKEGRTPVRKDISQLLKRAS